jgi:excisionase family DNA binding protein
MSSAFRGGYRGPRPADKPRLFNPPAPAIKTVVNVAAEPVLVDKPTACRLLGNIAERTLRQLVHDGDLNARKLGNRTLFEVDELRRFAAALPSWEPYK